MAGGVGVVLAGVVGVDLTGIGDGWGWFVKIDSGLRQSFQSKTVPRIKDV
jgi:hypothetical protein